MNKNIINRGTLVLGAVLMLASCTDMLEKEPLDGFQNNAEFWNETSTVEGYANEFYEEFPGYGKGNTYGTFYFKTLSDDQAGLSFSDWAYKTVPNKAADWKDPYEEIRRANVMIAGLEKSTMDEPTKNHWLGVARMIRGYEFYTLVRKYGDVIWVDKPLKTNDSEYLYGERTDRDVVMDKVLEDIEFATKNINETTSKIVWSRAMAYAMMSDICLWEGTFRKYRSAGDGQKAADEAGAKRYLEKCVEAYNYLKDDYPLSDNYRKIYNSLDLTTNSEIIMCKQYKKDIMSHSTIAYTASSTQISGMTKDAFDAYLFLDGKPLSSTTMNKSDVGVVDANNNIDISALLAVRDKRLSETIDPIVFYSGNTWSRTPKGQQMTSSTGYGVCKYDNTEEITDEYRNQTVKNYTSAPIFWMSVVGLNYVEARAELGTITDTDLDVINKLHVRAGLPNVTVASLEAVNDPANNMNVSSLIWEIRRERRCELMFDNDFRYWDLVRWHQLDKLDSNTYPNILLGANLTNAPQLKDNEGKDIAKPDMVNNYMDGSKGLQRTFDKKQYLYPIPSSQRTLNPKLGQNPGW